MTKNIPDSFLRFYGNAEFALDCIENKQLTLIHISKFNDPFDPIIDLLLECNWNFDVFIKWVQNHRRDLDENDIKKYKIKWSDTKEKLDKLYNDIRTKMFAACFCTEHKNIDGKTIQPQDNLYMWGHYGNGHRGVAISFKKEMFKKEEAFVIEHLEYRDELPVVSNAELYEVLFNGNFPLITNKHEQMLRTKSKNWEPEQEWRFKYTTDLKKLPWIAIPLPEDSINAVYLGCRLSGELRNNILMQTKKLHPAAKIYEAKMDVKNLGLVFDEL